MRSTEHVVLLTTSHNIVELLILGKTPSQKMAPPGLNDAPPWVRVQSRLFLHHPNTARAHWPGGWGFMILSYWIHIRPWVLEAEVYMFLGWSSTPQLPSGSFHPQEKAAISAEEHSILARTPYAIQLFRYKSSPVGRGCHHLSLSITLSHPTNRRSTLLHIPSRTIRWTHVPSWILQDCCTRPNNW